jgi:hypothetical protein
MKREGVLRQRVKKWGVFEDVVVIAILRNECGGARDAGGSDFEYAPGFHGG